MNRFPFATIMMLGIVSLSLAQKKEEPKKEPPPKLIVAPILGVDPGKTTKVTVRGLQVDTVTEIKLQEPKASGKVLGKGKKVPPPNNSDPNKIGDSEIEIEVTLPSEVPGRTVPFTLIGPGGESNSLSLLVNDSPRIPEKEPNDGFKQAQLISFPAVVEGKIQQGQDVDLFRFEGKADQEIVVEIQATEFGSPLEPMLSLWDRNQQLLTTADGDQKTDPVLKYKLPADGSYYLSLLDAHDQGGAIFVYRLRFRDGK
jgi:hypothetical protein